MPYLYFILPPVIMIISVALILFLLSRKSFELGGQKSKSSTFNNNEKYSKVKANLLPLVEKIVTYFKSIVIKLQKVLDGWVNSVREYKKNSQDKKDHILETSSDFSDDSSILKDSKETREIVDELEEGKSESGVESKSIESKIEKEKVVPMRKRWSKGLEFKRGAKKKINLKDKIIRKSKRETKPIVQPDTSRKLDNLVKKDVEEAPMISNSVVYPESKKIEMQRETLKKEQKKKRAQMEKILVERIAQDPRDVEAYERLGDHYRDQGNNKDALSCYKYVLKLSPLNEKAKRNIEEIKGLD